MTKSVRFCLSFDPSKWDFIAFNMGFRCPKKTMLTRTLSMTPTRARVVIGRYPLNNSDIMIKDKGK